MDDIISGVIHGAVTGFYVSVADFLGQRKDKKLKTRILKSRLENHGYKWRTLTQLARAIRQTPETTTDLLLEMGARRSAGEKDVWTLKK